MGTLVVTNLTSSPVWLNDLYTSVAASSTVTADRAPSQLPAMSDLASLVAAGTVSFTFTPSADEASSGIASPAASIEAQDMAPVAATDLASAVIGVRKSIAASGTNIAVYAANALPYKFRVLDAHFVVTAGNAGGRTITLYSDSGSSTAIGVTFDCSAAGRVQGALTALPLLTPGALVGLYAVKSNAAIAGELVLTVRRES